MNLWGVIHGIRVFVPIMLGQDAEAHVVNTASMAGFISPPWSATYNVTKHGVVTLSETLHHELAQVGARVKVSVLCPGWVKTRIADAERNRPARLQNEPVEATRIPQAEAAERLRVQLRSTGLSPEKVAEDVFRAIKDEKFYILTHPERKDYIRARMEDILEERNPAIDLAALERELLGRK